MKFYITYKNVLRSNKKKSDYKRWLKNHWAEQQDWGATDYDLWSGKTDNGRVLFCRYTVSNLEQWTAAAASPSSMDLVRELNKIVDMNRISIKITPNPNGHA